MPHYTPSPKELALGEVREGVLYTASGRELCITDKAYARRTQEMAERQGWKCAMCTRMMNSPTFDHESPRGMGGSSQDDALLHDDGAWKNAALCMPCNGMKASQRFHWTNNNSRYVRVPGV